MRYVLMHKRQSVLVMELDEATGNIASVEKIFRSDHVPVGISVERDEIDRAALNHWWTGRSIPASRSGIRDALDAIGIYSPKLLLTKCYGLSLSDQYWVCPENQNLQWEKINFFENPFSEDVGNILMGEHCDKQEISLLSPDNTSDGCLKKRWKIVNGTRCLIKGGSKPFYQEPFNEVLASKAMERLGIEHVAYDILWDKDLPYSICPDFITPDTELVSAHSICQSMERGAEISKYQHFLNCCQTLNIPNVQPAINKMLTIDYLIANEDRHMNNFGALRNPDTLEWLGLAPVFDCGTSLWYDHLFRWGRPENDCPSKPFVDTHSEQIKLVSTFEWLNLNALRGILQEWELILQVANQFITEERRETLVKAFDERILSLDHLMTQSINLPEQGYKQTFF